MSKYEEVNGFECCNDAYDLGWKHGTEDKNDNECFRPGLSLSPEDLYEYRFGYREAYCN